MSVISGDENKILSMQIHFYVSIFATILLKNVLIANQSKWMWDGTQPMLLDFKTLPHYKQYKQGRRVVERFPILKTYWKLLLLDRWGENENRNIQWREDFLFTPFACHQ